jgi:hypothetical protein
VWAIFWWGRFLETCHLQYREGGSVTLRCEVRKQTVRMNDRESYLGSSPTAGFLISGVETAGSANRL